jgi:hypothetical protein
MDRRLYLLIPDRQHALEVVDELVGHGIDTAHMHAIGDQRTRLDGLPDAELRQWNGGRRRVNKIFWLANLACFAAALVTLIIMPALNGFNGWLLLPVAVMVINFMVGLHFTNIPNTHLGKFRDALAHGEILLLVDVPESRVAEVETDIHRRHPEAAVGGVSWGTQAYGL